ncbi:MAG: AMP-binding protein [Desulfatirhabdiaceae bacterium]
MHSTISADSLLPIVTGLMSELHPDIISHRPVTLDSGLDRDLGLDSLARMELFARLEKEFGVRLPEQALVTAETPRDLLRDINRETSQMTPSSTRTVAPSDEKTSGRESGLSGAKTLLDVLEQHITRQPDAVHITLLQGDEEIRITYAMLHQEALRVAARLRQLDMEPWEPVAIMLPTSPDYFYAFWGILHCGGIPVPLYPPARPAQIEEHVRRHRKIMSNAGAKILITVPEAKPVARLLMSQVPELRKIVTTDNLYATEAEKFTLPHRENDIAFLQYTSGSTGDPKGVILTHANLLANIRAMGRICEVTTRDVFVSWLPLYHDMGLIGAWFGSLCHGCSLVVMPPLSFLARPERWLHTIDRFGGTLSASPNFGYEICATRLGDDVLSGLNLRSWRLALNGAEPVTPDTLRRFQNRFQPYGFRPEALAPVYGLAESTVGLIFPTPGTGVRIDRVLRETFVSSGKAVPARNPKEPALEFPCCGRPLPGHQVRIVDSRERELPEREEGRLQFTGPSSTSGYFRNADETRKLFHGDWLETGDLGYISEGDVYITGRVKDIIFRGGRNIYPHELEEIIGNIPGIRKGCTAVFASVNAGSAIERLVVLTESRQTTPEALRGLRQQIADATIDLLGMAPDDVVIAPPGAVLKTSSGKIRRSACRQLYESGNIGQKKTAVRMQLMRMGLRSVGPLLQRLGRRMTTVLYAGYAWLVMALAAVVSWCALMVVPGDARRWRLGGQAVRTICRLTGIHLKTVGMTHMPVGQPYLVVSNHMSYLDSIILAGVLPERCNFVAKAELARNPFLRAVFTRLEVFLVNRFDAVQGIADTTKIDAGVRRGLHPIFFSEGTLQRMPGLLPFQMGAFVLASREQLPVVPVIIQGTRNILRGGSWFPRRGRIQVTIRPPLRPTGTDWQSAVELRDRVRREILQHLGEPDLAGEYASLLQTGLKPPETDGRNLSSEN